MQYMPCDRLWAPMLNDMRYGCMSSNNILALSNLGLNVCPLGCTSPQQFASLLNTVKVVRLQAEHQCCCLDIDSNRVRVHVKHSMHCAPLWLHALSYLFPDTPKFFSFQKSTNLINNIFFQQIHFHQCLQHPLLHQVQLPGLEGQDGQHLHDLQSIWCHQRRYYQTGWN